MTNEEVREENIRWAIEAGINALTADGVYGIQNCMAMQTRHCMRQREKGETDILYLVKNG